MATQHPATAEVPTAAQALELLRAQFL